MNPLDLAREKQKKLRAEGLISAPRNPIQRWKDNNTRKSAVEATCWYCMGGSESENEGVRETIRNCTSGPESSLECPIFQWRPYRCQPWRAERRLVNPGSREAALLTRRALRQRGSKVGFRTRRPAICGSAA